MFLYNLVFNSVSKHEPVFQPFYWYQTLILTLAMFYNFMRPQDCGLMMTFMVLNLKKHDIMRILIIITDATGLARPSLANARHFSKSTGS